MSQLTLMERWRKVSEKRFFNWVDERTPKARQYRLNHKNLYTFPNWQGALYLLLILVVWVMGTNYQNNLILALCYLLSSLFVVAILHAYANLAGINLQFIGAEPVFAGDKVGFVVELVTHHRQGSEAIQLRWAEGEPEPVSLKPNEPVRVTLWLNSRQRGYLRPARLLVQSRFPLGIIRCWTWLRLDAEALVYPQPLPLDEPLSIQGEGSDQGAQTAPAQGDEFQGLRNYVIGDSIKHIAWKQFAQDRGLYTKEYQQLISAEKWLNWDGLNYPQEERLSALCHWALRYEQLALPYGLLLPSCRIEPNLGSEHLFRVLSQLATFRI